MLSKERDFQVVFRTDLVGEARTSGAAGDLTLDEALKQLLTGTGLTYRYLDDKTVTILPVNAQEQNGASTKAQVEGSGGANSADKEGKKSSSDQFRLAQVDQGKATGEASVEKQDEQASKKKADKKYQAIPEIVVEGSRILNTDIPRTRDDPQPYVIFDRETIERSAAVNLGDFFKQRLTMNTVGQTSGQIDAVVGNMSSINLRGLGTNQTLILIDGHRPATFYAAFSLGQSDVNGIPLAAVERIEVLPTTASGIYGGGATGGVINIILKRDYSGSELKLAYDNSFAADSANRRVDLSAGFNLEGGKTNLLLAASYSDANLLLQQDRDFLTRGRANILANNSNDYRALNLLGSPPLGATSNILSANGSNLVLKNGTALNALITYVPVGYAGPAADAGSALVGNAGKYNLALGDSASFLGGGKFGLLNGPTSKSLTVTLRRQFSPQVQAFLEGNAADITGRFAVRYASSSFTLPATAATNPFMQNILVTVPGVGSSDAHTVARNGDRGLLGGLIVQLPRHWMMEVDYTWSRYRQQYLPAAILDPALGGTTAVSNGTLNVLRDTHTYPVDFSPYLASSRFYGPFDSTLKDASLRVSGPVTSLPAGALTLSTLIERKDELYGAGTFPVNSTLDLVFPSRSQSVNSLYLEARVPLVSMQNKVPGIPELELQLAGRRDEYTVNGVTGSLANPTPTTPIVRSTTKVSSTDPTIALSYKPIQDLMLRASYGTGFLPPTVNQILPSPSRPGAFTDLDPRRGNTPVGAAQFINGGNANLQPEQSESWSAGVVFTPHVIPNARLSIDYTKISKTNNIISPSVAQLLANESVLPGRIVRGPNLPTDQPGWAGPITLIDQSNVNIARAEVEAYDVQLDFRHETARFGSLDFFALATWQTHYKTQLLPSLLVVENVGIESSDFSSIPVKLKANAGLTWDYRDWTVGWNARYFDSYLVADPTQALNAVTIKNQGNGGRVPSQVYHDLFMTYRFVSLGRASTASRLLSNTEVQLGVRNIFNTKPPFDAASILWGYYSILGDPRLASYYVSLKKSF